MPVPVIVPLDFAIKSVVLVELQLLLPELVLLRNGSIARNSCITAFIDAGSTRLFLSDNQ